MEEILTVLISAGTGALIGGVGSVITTMLSNRHAIKKIELEHKLKVEDNYFEAKVNAYKIGLNYFLYLKKLLSVSKQVYQRNKDIRDEVEKAYSNVKGALALLRLFSSNEVFDYYESLYKRYEPFFLYEEDGWRLLEDSKEIFDLNICKLSRLMNYDLGYQEINEKENFKIKCPSCKTEHSRFERCPKCNLTVYQYENGEYKVAKKPKKTK